MLAGVVIGDFGKLAGGDLNEVAEDVVEFNLERVDAGALALVFLEAGDPILTTARCGAEFVKLGGVAVADDVAVFDVGGGLVAESGF